MEFSSSKLLLGTAAATKEKITVTVEANPSVPERRNLGRRTGDQVLVDLMDTAGQEEYSAMRDQYYRTTDCMLIAYAINNQNSLQQGLLIHEQVMRVRDGAKTVVAFVGCKTDLEHSRTVPAKPKNLPNGAVTTRSASALRRCVHETTAPTFSATDRSRRRQRSGCAASRRSKRHAARPKRRSAA